MKCLASLCCLLTTGLLAAPLSPDRLPDRQWTKVGRALTIGQMKQLLWDHKGHPTVQDMEKWSGVRPIVVSPVIHHWPLSDGTLCTVSSPQPNGSLWITCWGPP
jgi:hypothetical protein